MNKQVTWFYVARAYRNDTILCNGTITTRKTGSELYSKIKDQIHKEQPSEEQWFVLNIVRLG